MKVSIKDFQIVKSANLEFTPGLTVIQGESNNGKSALFRAIKSCIYNEPGTTNVRVGCKNYMVGIEHNNHKIILQKGENSLYLIDGQQYNKIGKSQPEEVGNALGIKALSINGQTEKINFWDQMEKPFLLDRNSSDLFRFIVDSGEDDSLNDALRSMVTDKNKLNVDKNLKEGSINTLKQQIDNMNILLAGSEEKIQLCENVISFGPMTSKLLTINNTITNINKTTETIEETNKIIIKEKEEIEKRLQELNTLSYSISKKEQVNELSTKYNNVIIEINKVNELLKNKVDYKVIIPTLEKVLVKRDKVEELVKRISDINDFIKNNSVTRLELSIGQDIVKKSDTMKQLLDRYTNVTNQINVINTDIKSTKDEMSEYVNQLSEFKVCPYCKQTLTEGGIHND